MPTKDKREFAKHLRHNQTPVEEILWGKIRARRLNGYKFRRQVPINDFVADFLCVSQKLIIEVDGDSHDDNVEYDAERTAILENYGYHILRYRNEDVYFELEDTLNDIVRSLENATP